MIAKIGKFLPLIFLSFYAFLIFRPILSGKLPLPSDALSGLYHPWRDFFSDQYPNGMAYKNFLVTDPVRQHYPWRQLAVTSLTTLRMPVWNPYVFGGAPLAGNLQAAAFYPSNILYFVLSFDWAWTVQIVSQVFLGGYFMYLFLKNKKLAPLAVSFGMLTWVGSGFWVAWLTLNTLVQTVLWLPFVLWASDRFFETKRLWFGLVAGSGLGLSFLAGAVQPFFYLCLFSGCYFFRSGLVSDEKLKFAKFIFLVAISFFILTCYQIIPALTFWTEATRNLNLGDWQKTEWFLPWQHLIQFLIPDYFGNPATMNYFGIWNYMEFVGYVGVGAIIFGVIAALKLKNIRFWVVVILVCLILMLPTPVARLPYAAKVPFLTLGQPTRMIFLVDFSLAVLAAYGFNFWLKEKSRNLGLLIWLLGGVLLMILISLSYAIGFHLDVSLRNTIWPFAVFLGTITFLFGPTKVKSGLAFGLVSLAMLDLFRFSTKFEPFASRSLVFPKTRAIEFLTAKTKKDFSRIASLEDGVIPGNVNVMYRLATVGGYDSLIITRYGQLISSIEKGRPDLSSNLGYNRIIIPRNFESKLFPLLAAKYIVTTHSQNSPLLDLIFEEGQTKVYAYSRPLPRAYFGTRVVPAKGAHQAMEILFNTDFKVETTSVAEGLANEFLDSHPGKVTYFEDNWNELKLKTSDIDSGFLVLLDSYFSRWQATIDGKPSKIYPTNHAFRGLLLPPGDHEIVFKLGLL